MSSVAAASASSANGIGTNHGDTARPREPPTPSLSVSVGWSPFNQGPSSATSPAAVPMSQQSFTLRSSMRLNSTSQPQSALDPSTSSKRTGRGSRSQCHTGATARNRSSPLQPFLHLVNVGESAPTPMASGHSPSISNSGGGGGGPRLAHPPPSERSVNRGHSKARGGEDGRCATSRHEQQHKPPETVASDGQRQQTGKEEPSPLHYQGPLYTPYTLKRRSAVEDIYTACFLTTLQEENLDNELVYSFKASMAKVGSPFASVRNEGLCEALQQIRAVGMCAAAEAQQGQADGQAALRNRRAEYSTGAGKGSSTDPAGTSKHGTSPYPRSPSPRSNSIGGTQPAQPSQQQQQGGVTGGAGPLLPPADAFLVPFDAIRATMTSASGAGADADQRGKNSTYVPYTSETWNRAQRALAGTDFTSALFRRVLAPRSEVRAAMNMGGPVNVELSTEDALAWSSRRPPVELSPLEKLKLESKRAMMAKAGVGRQQQLEQQFQPSTSLALNSPDVGDGGGELSRRMTPCGFEVVVPETPIYATMTEITYEEQTLALQLLQGFCVTVNYQRRCIAEGCFFHYATEVFQCFLQHVEAVFTRRRLLHLSKSASSGGPSSIHRSGGTQPPGSAAGNDGLVGGSSVYLSGPITLGGSGGSSTFSPLKPTNSTPAGPTSLNLPSVVVVPSSIRLTENSHDSQLDSSPVDVEEEQVAVIVALIDAVEAACHYNPTCLTRLVQTGGVTAMLNLVYSPCVPESVRAAVLDTISVLMQEVAPFRRAVAAAPSVFADGQQQQQQQQIDLSSANGEWGVEDTLLTIMLEQARTGSYNYPGAQQSGDPPPFMMDRASASKFESAVREWFSKHGLSHATTGATELRNLKDWRRLRLVQQQQRAGAAGVSAGGEGGGGGGNGTAAGIVTTGGGASIETTRDSKRATQQRASSIMALLQVIDGKRADLQ